MGIGNWGGYGMGLGGRQFQGLPQYMAQAQAPMQEQAPQGMYGKFNSVMNNPNALSAINTLAGALQQKGRYAGARGTDAMLSTLLKGNQGQAVGRTLGQNTGPQTMPVPQGQTQPTGQTAAVPPPSRIQQTSPMGQGGMAPQAVQATPTGGGVDPYKLMMALGGAPAIQGIENPNKGTAANAGNAVPTAPQAQNPIAAALGGVPQIPQREYPTMPFKPFARNSNIGPNPMDLMMLNALNEPNYLPDLIKQRQANEVARRNADISAENALANRMNAVTHQRTADISEAERGDVSLERRAQALGNLASAEKTLVDTQRGRVSLAEEQRLAALGPEGALAEAVKKTERIESAKKRGEITVVREETERLAKEQDSIPVPVELQKTLPYKTMGDVLRYKGTEVYKQAIQDTAAMARSKVQGQYHVAAAAAGNPAKAEAQRYKNAKDIIDAAQKTIANYDKTTYDPSITDPAATKILSLKNIFPRTAAQQAEYMDAKMKLSAAQNVLMGISGQAPPVQAPQGAEGPIEEEVVKNNIWYTKRGGVWGQESGPRPTTLGPIKKAKGESVKESATAQPTYEEPISTREALRRRRIAAPKNE